MRCIASSHFDTGMWLASITVLVVLENWRLHARHL